MNNNFRWIAVVAALVLAVGVGVMAYNAGVAHGVAQSGKIVVPPPGSYPVYPYAGWHPWGFGFFLAPLFFLFFFFFVVRALFWGAGWRRGRMGGCGYRGLDEWHREAHQTMSGGTPQQ
jgi:hypothetical protein